MRNKRNLAIALFLVLLLPFKSLAIDQIPLVCYHDCKLGSAGLILIKQFEGYSPFVYKDVAGHPTIGFGHLIIAGEKIKTPLMGDAAIALLQRDAAAKVAKVNQLVKVPLSTNQFDALVDFAYNLGTANLARSTLLKKVNSKQDSEVPPKFLEWDKADGKVFKSLTFRRKTEAMLYSDDEFAGDY